MVEAVLGKHFVPAALLGVVLDHNDLELLLPLGMQSVDLIDEVLTADRADNSVAGSDERVDDVGSNKGVGACEECGRHRGDLVKVQGAGCKVVLEMCEEMSNGNCVFWRVNVGHIKQSNRLAL